MRILKTILLIGLAVLALLLVGAAALFFAPVSRAPPVDYAAEAADYMARNFSKIQRDGKGVRLEAEQREVFYYRPDSRPPAGASRGTSVVLVPGDYVVRFAHHSSDSFTVRQVLADKVVIEYMFFHSFNGRDEKYTGSVDIPYRGVAPRSGSGDAPAPAPAVLQKYEGK